MGWCSMMTDMSRWTPEQKAAAKREFDTYKQILAVPLIQHGATCIMCPSGPTDGVGTACNITIRAMDAVFVFAFRGTTTERRHVFQLKGLEPAARYRLICQGRPPVRRLSLPVDN